MEVDHFGNDSEFLWNVSLQNNDIARRNSFQLAISGLFLFAIMTLAISGNIMVIGAIFSYPHLKQDKSNMFIMNLALTDLLSAIVVMNSAFISLVSDEWLFGVLLCDLACAANYCLIIVSMLTLCFISIDRYQAILHPLHYVCRINRKRISAMIVYSWIQGVTFASIPVFFRWIQYDYWEVICAIEWHKDPQALYYVIFAFMLCFFFPGLVLISCYTCVLKEVRHCKIGCIPKPAHVNNLSKQNRQRYSNANSKTVLSLLLVVIAYFVCLTPFCVTKLIKVISLEPGFVPGYANLTASWFGYTSSAVNPLIYGIFRHDFRSVFVKMVQKLPALGCKNKQSYPPTINQSKQTGIQTTESSYNMIQTTDTRSYVSDNTDLQATR